MTRSRRLLLLAAMVVPVFAVWRFSREVHARKPSTGLKVVVVGLDGAHLGLLSPLLAENRLPNLRAYLENATLGVMSSPIHDGFTSPALWTSIVTGREPYDHGITDFVLPDPATCKDVAAASGHRTAPALWNILDQERISAAIVPLWATWPAEPLKYGAIVSDHVSYSRMRLSNSFRGPGDETVAYQYKTVNRNVHPESILAQVSERVRLPGDVTADDLRRFIPDLDNDEIRKILKGPYGDSIQSADKFQELKVTLQSDRSYAAIGLLVDDVIDPSFLLVYLQGIDVIEHNFWPYHDPAYPRPLDEPRERLAEVVDRYAIATDEWIRPYLEMASEDTVVIVVSDHGFATANEHPLGRWHDANAIFFAAGGPVKRRYLLDPGSISIYDVTPTLLALLGLPVAEDMPGRVIEEMLDPGFLQDHPVQKVASYGRRPLNPAAISESEIDDAYRKRLAETGYVSAARDDRATSKGPIDLAHWDKTPAVFARPATDCDVELGRAVFTSRPGDHARPGHGPLPHCAIYTDEKGEEHPVVVIQIEEALEKTRVGFRFLDGRRKGTTADRIEFLPKPDERFRQR